MMVDGPTRVIRFTDARSASVSSQRDRSSPNDNARLVRFVFVDGKLCNMHIYGDRFLHRCVRVRVSFSVIAATLEGCAARRAVCLLGMPTAYPRKCHHLQLPRPFRRVICVCAKSTERSHALPLSFALLPVTWLSSACTENAIHVRCTVQHSRPQNDFSL